jgi:hypothetical protein
MLGRKDARFVKIPLTPFVIVRQRENHFLNQYQGSLWKLGTEGVHQWWKQSSFNVVDSPPKGREYTLMDLL